MASNGPPPAGVNGPYTALPSSGGNTNGLMPSAGHFADLQALMQNLDNLSGWLQQNREDYEGLRDGLRRVEAMEGRSAIPATAQQHLENGVDGEETDQSSNVITLRRELMESLQRNSELQSQLSSFQNLHALFNTTLHETMRLIRNYTYNQQTYIADLHRHYTKLLQDARYETLEARLIHQKWQEGLTHVSETCREAVKAREDEAESKGWRAEIQGLRLENAVLRRKVGWELRAGDEAILELEKDEQEVAQGRGGRGSLGFGRLGESRLDDRRLAEAAPV